MVEKYLQVRKEGFFTRVVNFFRKALYKEQINIEEPSISNEIVDNKNSFLNEIKIEKEESLELINLQKQFESKEIELASMSDEEVHNLNMLYKRQIEDLKKKLESKKTELNMIKNRIKNYSVNT